jgi:archaemetzincin
MSATAPSGRPRPDHAWRSFRSGALLGLMREYASVFFGFEVSLRVDAPVPDAAHIPGRDQHNSSMILDALAAAAAPGDPLLLAITDVDLFSRGTTYVFGEGNLERRVGICSLARLQSPDEGLVRRRALRLLSHEAGHLLSIPHCIRRRCVMQGSNTLEESDRHPMEPCSQDLRKIRWSTGVDLARRGAGLRRWYDRWGWPLESGFGNSDLG